MPEEKREYIHRSFSSGTLLGLRPIEIDINQKKLYLYQGGEIVPLKMFYGSCETHKKKVPAEGCTCGFRSRINAKWALNWLNVRPDLNSDRWVTMGVFQLLGNTIVENDGLRSKGGFLWGIIRPRLMPSWVWMAVYDVGLPNTLRPAFYSDLDYAWHDIQATWRNHEMKLKDLGKIMPEELWALPRIA